MVNVKFFFTFKKIKLCTYLCSEKQLFEYYERRINEIKKGGGYETIAFSFKSSKAAGIKPVVYKINIKYF